MILLTVLDKKEKRVYHIYGNANLMGKVLSLLDLEYYELVDLIRLRRNKMLSAGKFLDKLTDKLKPHTLKFGVK